MPKVIDLPTATSMSDDDYFVTEARGGGTKKITRANAAKGGVVSNVSTPFSVNLTSPGGATSIFQPFPEYYVAGSTEDTRIQALLQQICTDFPNREKALFIGTVSPSTKRIVTVYFYNTSDLVSGLPRYCFGEWMSLDNNNIIRFRTYDGAYSSRTI